ncbi:MAG: rRNA pseudouridine synthase [Chloroflexi bacterium]|nr:rRNA pseudouridine synthase [Chloroflexota bacterium]
MAEERLQKLLARAGVTSRRRAEELVRAGRVTIDGVRVSILGAKADPDRQRISLDGRDLSFDIAPLYLAFNKPRGVVTTLHDPQGRSTVAHYLPGFGRVFPAGRLDVDSEGLLLLSNNGDFALRVSHPRYGCDKEYSVLTVAPTEHQWTQLRSTIQLDDGPARLLSVRHVALSTIGVELSVTLAEGRNREVRRIFAAVGLPVHRLIRTRIGVVRLGALASGHLRLLRSEEVAWFLRRPETLPLERRRQEGRPRRGALAHHRD